MLLTPLEIPYLLHIYYLTLIHSWRPVKSYIFHETKTISKYANLVEYFLHLGQHQFYSSFIIHSFIHDSLNMHFLNALYYLPDIVALATIKQECKTSPTLSVPNESYHGSVEMS